MSDDFKPKSISRQTSKEPDPNQKFWDAADDFIRLANEACKTADRGQVCAAIMYAAARFNAFAASVDAPNLDVFKKETDPAIKYFRGEFEKMLRENLRDYTENFHKYHPEKNQ
ncbi:DUF3144 domain-containing protein [uncultured Oxalicibacterium sp.]|uniref:DUF3144 domain-containing protein n=1 Tax=uncultured Oxalicibacterium sp. TaxID=1168540 RepID=UPI0025FD4689|nr:DUF3144 domain-containing protein [uncultured Oxalicibacterium sp.]